MRVRINPPKTVPRICALVKTAPVAATVPALLAWGAATHGSRDVPRPVFWGGYRLTPNRFEFWQHREDRLHDRIVYLPIADGWSLERQAP